MSDVILATKAYVDSKLDGGGGGTPVDPLEYRDLLHWSPEGTERTVQQLLAGVRFVYGLPRKLKEITFDTAPVDFSGAVLNVYVRAASAADSFELLMEGLPATEGNLTFVFPEGLMLEAYSYTFLFEVLFPTPRTAWVQEGLIVSPYHGHDLREYFDFIACGANAEALDVNTISLPSLPNNLSFRMNMGCATEIPVPIPWGKALLEGDFPQVDSTLTALGWPEQHDFRKPSVFHEPVSGPEPQSPESLATKNYVDSREVSEIRLQDMYLPITTFGDVDSITSAYANPAPYIPISVYFTANADMPFSYIAVANTGENSGYVTLQDLTTPHDLMGIQPSTSIPAKSVGLATINQTLTLQAGHEYRLAFGGFEENRLGSNPLVDANYAFSMPGYLQITSIYGSGSGLPYIEFIQSVNFKQTVGKLPLSDLQRGGANFTQVLGWNGTQWSPLSPVRTKDVHWVAGSLNPIYFTTHTSMQLLEFQSAGTGNVAWSMSDGGPFTPINFPLVVPAGVVLRATPSAVVGFKCGVLLWQEVPPAPI